MYSLKDYYYDLPEDRIAQQPMKNRDRSRLLTINRDNGTLSHHLFDMLPELLEPSDLLVVNNTQVVPGRLLGHKETGGRAELLILNYAEARRQGGLNGEFICRGLIKASKSPKPGTRILFDRGLEAEVTDSRDGLHTVRLTCSEDFETVLYRIGHVPLPPYIKRNLEQAPPVNDSQTYQTVYAEEKGAIAAPTAGLHFTEPLMEKIRAKGVQIAAITLHVGYGTFVPVRVSDIREHQMHSEWFHISRKTAEQVNRTKEKGGRVIAVGTTSVRTLEYASDQTGRLIPQSGDCNLFIYPGYEFKMVDAMITNFHLPESTLLMLVSAFAGRENILNAYRTAVEEKYRFYSYGDAMFIS